MRIIVGSIMHESNTFSTIKTDLNSFQKTQLLLGDELINYHAARRTEIGGLLHTLKNEDVEVVPTLSAVALPSGIVTDSTYEFLKEELITGIEKAKSVDGVLLVFHGAMVSEGLDDPEGDLLEEVRKIVGDKVYIGLTLDLHANISVSIAKNTDFIIGYRTHPHTDQWKTGQRAASIMVSLIKERISTVIVMKKLPMILPAETRSETRAKLLKKIDKLERKDEIITASFFLGYPWADVSVIGPSVVVVTKGSPELAEKEANELAKLLWRLRDNFSLPTLSIDDAINEAVNTRGGPVVFCDMGDCLFGGAAGDVTTLLSAILRKGIKNAALAALVDPDSVQKAIQAGEGQEIALELGGKLDRINSKALKVKGKVKLITSKSMVEDSMHSGYEINMGHLVVLEMDNDIEVVVAEHGGRVYEPVFLYNLDIHPESKKVIVIKDAFGPLLTYRDIAKKVIFINSPGWCNQDFTLLKYNRIPRLIFPLDSVEYLSS
jgi:microcystin degradation protein MlrC